MIDFEIRLGGRHNGVCLLLKEHTQSNCAQYRSLLRLQSRLSDIDQLRSVDESDALKQFAKFTLATRSEVVSPEFIQLHTLKCFSQPVVIQRFSFLRPQTIQSKGTPAVFASSTEKVAYQGAGNPIQMLLEQ